MTIATEAHALIHAALEGDPALASLIVAGFTPETLSVNIAPGVPTKAIGGSIYDSAPPFRRETLAELILRMQRLRWQRVAAITQMVLPPDENVCRNTMPQCAGLQQ